MNKQRFHQLDFCRAVFMYCGLLFHCGLIYGSGHSWRVLSDETVTWLGLLSNFLHHFRMEAFYLVSGFFYLLILQKGREKFLQDRILRALIPMLVVGLTLNVIMNRLSYNHNFNWGLDYFLSGQWQAHLWFLGNLIVYFVAAKPLGTFLNNNQNSYSKYLPLVFFMLMLVALAGHLFAVNYELGTLIFINFGYLFYFFPFFVMGILAFHAKLSFFKFIQIKLFPIYFGIYALIQLLTKMDSGLNADVLAILKQASHFPLMLAAFSFLCFFGNKQSSIVRFLSEASYTIYLLHQPLIIILHTYLFAHIQLGAVNEYFLMITLVFMICGPFHMLLVEKFPILKLLLNGVAFQNPKKSLNTTRAFTNS